MILLIGASASGKTEIGKYLEEHFNIKKIVTYTTRPKRENEVDDIDYHFISLELFLKFKESNFFFETMYYNENFYGTAYKDFDENTYLIVDPKGLKEYKNSKLKTTAFFLSCNTETRKRRMEKRGDNILDINQRLKVDEGYFDEKKLNDIDYIINADVKSIEQLASNIYNIYKKC